MLSPLYIDGHWRYINKLFWKTITLTSKGFNDILTFRYLETMFEAKNNNPKNLGLIPELAFLIVLEDVY